MGRTGTLATLLAVAVWATVQIRPAHAEDSADFQYDEALGKCVDRRGVTGLNSGSPAQLRATRSAECADFGRGHFNLTYLRLTGGNLRGANFEGVSFYLGTFTDAGFRGANLDRSSGQVDYDGADLRGASFLGAKLLYSTFKGARLEGARFDASTELPFSREEAEARGMTFVRAGAP